MNLRFFSALLVLGFIGAWTVSLPASAQTVFDNEIFRAVPSGQRRQIWKVWDLNENCETYRGFSVQIDRQPRAGKMELQKVTEPVSLQWINPRIPPHFQERVHQCLGRPVPTIAVFYTSRGAPGVVDQPAISVVNPRTRVIRRVQFEIVSE